MFRKNIALFTIILLGLTLSVFATMNGQGDKAGSEVSIVNSKYEPKKLSVVEGSTVKWTNKEGSHTVTSDDDAFNSKVLQPNDSFSYQFTKPGTYQYHCKLHGASMSGTITVTKKK